MEQPRQRARRAKPPRRAWSPPAQRLASALQPAQRAAADDLRAGRPAVRRAHRRKRRSRATTRTRSRSSTTRSSWPNRPASRPTTCSTAAICCSTSSPRWRSVTVTKQPDGTDTVTFGDAAKPLVEGTTVNWPQALTSAQPAASSARCWPHRPGGTLTGYPDRTRRGRRRRSPRPSTRCTPSTPFFTGTTAATLDGRRDASRSADLLDGSARRQRRGARDRRPARRRRRPGLLGAGRATSAAPSQRRQGRTRRTCRRR